MVNAQVGWTYMVNDFLATEAARSRSQKIIILLLVRSPNPFRFNRTSFNQMSDWLVHRLTISPSRVSLSLHPFLLSFSSSFSSSFFHSASLFSIARNVFEHHAREKRGWFSCRAKFDVCRGWPWPKCCGSNQCYWDSGYSAARVSYSLHIGLYSWVCLQPIAFHSGHKTFQCAYSWVFSFQFGCSVFI